MTHPVSFPVVRAGESQGQGQWQANDYTYGPQPLDSPLMQSS